MDRYKVVLISLLGVLLWWLLGTCGLILLWGRENIVWELTLALIIGVILTLSLARRIFTNKPHFNVSNAQMMIPLVGVPLVNFGLGVLFAMNFGLWNKISALTILVWMLLGSGIVQIIIMSIGFVCIRLQHTH